MTWDEYIKGYDNLYTYMKDRHGERGKYLIQSMDTRIAIPLNDRFSVVTDINNMVFGQFIMAERALTSGSSYKESLYSLSTSILRPLTDVVFDNTDDVKEQANLDAIMQQKAKDVITECIAFSDKRNKFIKEDFKGVFYKADDEAEDDGEDEGEDEPESFEDSFNRDWYWYTITDSLADNKLWMHETILMMKMRDVAPHLAYMRMKGIIEYKRRKSEELASKLRR